LLDREDGVEVAEAGGAQAGAAAEAGVEAEPAGAAAEAGVEEPPSTEEPGAG